MDPGLIFVGMTGSAEVYITGGCYLYDQDNDQDNDQDLCDFGDTMGTTNYYVDLDSGKRPVNGGLGTEIAPWKYIDNAIDNVADDINNIYVETSATAYDGANDPDNALNYWYIGKTGKTINFIASNGPVKVKTTLVTSYIFLVGDLTGISFTNFDFLTSGNVRHIGMDTASKCDLTLTDCTFTQSTDAKQIIYIIEDMGTISMSGCTITSDNSGHSIAVANSTYDSLVIDNCTISNTRTNQTCLTVYGTVGTCASTSITNSTLSSAIHYAVDMQTGTYSNVVFTDNVIPSGKGGLRFMDGTVISAGNISRNTMELDAATGAPGLTLGGDQITYEGSTFEDITIDNNTIGLTGTAEGDAHVVLLGPHCTNCTFTNNTTYGGNYGLVLKGNNCTVTGNIIKSKFALFLSQGYSNTVKYNSLVSFSDGALSYNQNQVVEYASGKDLDEGTLGNATVTQGSDTVTIPDGGGGETPDLTLVEVGFAFIPTGRTDGRNGTSTFKITGVDNTAKEITISPTPTAANTTAEWFIAGVQRASTFTNNVCIGNTGNYAFSTTNDDHWDNIVDSNFYTAGTAGVSIIVSGGAQNTIAAMQSKWNSFTNPPAVVGNDSNSIVAGSDPFVNVDLTTTDPTGDDFTLTDAYCWLDAGAFLRGCPDTTVSPVEVSFIQTTQSTISQQVKVPETTIVVAKNVVAGHTKTQYRLYENHSNTPFITLSSTSSTATNGNLKELTKNRLGIILTPNTKYKVSIRAYGSQGWSAWSSLKNLKTRDLDYKYNKGREPTITVTSRGAIVDNR